MRIRADRNRTSVFVIIWLALFNSPLFAQYLDTIGVTLLRETTTNLNGTGIRVCQPEAYDPYTPPGTNTWEVNPSTVGQPTNLFTYYSASGTAHTFTNTIGYESDHADSVADYFYGIGGDEATNVTHVDNYDANYFVLFSESVVLGATNYTVTLPSTNIDDSVVNQSFDVPGASVALQEATDSAYDNYAAKYGVLFVSGVGNGGPVNPPGTCYNGIGVGDNGGGSSYGPTLDNGRCKPDIVGTQGDTSWDAPEVAGAAAILMQAGLRGDGGVHTNAAADIRTVKALLLNGAVKPADWSNVPPEPLSTNYGAGVLNVFNTYRQLTGGEYGYSVSNSVTQGSAHPPVPASNFIPVLVGWDFSSITSSSSGIFQTAADGVNHYFFKVTNDVPGGGPFSLTSTLVWDRQEGQTNINHLALFLYNCANSNLVACSTSMVDNVQQIFLPQLAQGTYDLQVWKAGGTYVSAGESYALAWTFTSTPLAISTSGANIDLSWPVYPAGFVVESSTNLSPPIVWSTNLAAPIFTNNQNVVSIAPADAAQFFRLLTP